MAIAPLQTEAESSLVIPVISPIAVVANTVATSSALSTSTVFMAKFAYYNSKYSLSVERADRMFQTIKCETGGTFDTNIQSFHIDPRTGKREESYGLPQINLPHHPDITKEQATNMDFSLNWMAQIFSTADEKTLQGLWTCYRNIYGKK